MANNQTLTIGTTLRGDRNYVIKEVLGQGGFGITYKAEAMIKDKNISHRGLYCIKEFFLQDCCSRDAAGNVVFIGDAEKIKDSKADFKGEAENLKKFNQDPGIVPVNEIFEANGTVYYVMEFLDGQSLEKMVRVKKRLPEADAIKIIAEVSNALTKVHQAKMTHLDIRPENIMMVNDGSKYSPILIDFGLSCHYNWRGKMSQDKVTFGVSDGFSPEEQYAFIDHFSPESDIYALAATLFFMLTGNIPLKAMDVTEQWLSRELDDNFISSTTKEAVIKAMKRDASQRTSSTVEFLSDLGATVNVKPTGGKGTQRIDLDPKPKKSWGKIVGGIVVAIVLVVAIASVLSPDDPTPQPAPQPTPQPAPEPTPQPVPEPTPQPAPEPTPQPTPEPTPLPTPPPTPEPISSGTLKLSYGTWNGGIKNGKPHGTGVMTFTGSKNLDGSHTAKAGDKLVDCEYHNGSFVCGVLQSDGQDTFIMNGN